MEKILNEALVVRGGRNHSETGLTPEQASLLTPTIPNPSQQSS